MARFAVVVSLVRSLACCLIAIFLLTTAQAQISTVNDTTSTPIPG